MPPDFHTDMAVSVGCRLGLARLSTQVDSFTRLEDKMRSKMNKGSYVCQDYVSNPCLVNGLKFDLRIYASLISLDPVKVYVCKEGLARFCTEKYSPPDPKKGGSADALRSVLMTFLVLRTCRV